MDEEKPVPDLYDELERTSTQAGPKVIPEEEIPPPPRDWVSHPVTKTILWLVVLAIVAGLIWKAPAWIAYAREHTYGAGLVAFLAAAAVILILFGYWRYRAKGWVGQSNWDTRRKRRPE